MILILVTNILFIKRRYIIIQYPKELLNVINNEEEGYFNTDLEFTNENDIYSLIKKLNQNNNRLLIISMCSEAESILTYWDHKELLGSNFYYEEWDESDENLNDYIKRVYGSEFLNEISQAFNEQDIDIKNITEDDIMSGEVDFDIYKLFADFVKFTVSKIGCDYIIVTQNNID